VVTAEGELVRADEDHHSDLYRAARGAGPGFCGVVTRFHLRTRPRFGHLAQTVQAYHLDDFDEVMTWLHGLPGEADDDAEAQRALAPFRGYPALGRALAVIDARPTTMAEQVLPAARRAYTTLPNDRALTIWFSMAPLQPLPDMAFSLQSEIYLASFVLWQDPAGDERYRGWLAAAMAGLEPVTVGQDLGDSDLRTREVKSMSDRAWERLRAIRGARDPERLFAGHLAAGPEPRNANHWADPVRGPSAGW
jgi:hypothetical protein